MCSTNQLQRVLSSVHQYALQTFDGNLRSVILYGSYARGDHDDESDIDIMILVDLPASSLSKYSWPLAHLSSELSLSLPECTTISICLKDTDTFDRYKDALPFYQNVQREGVEIVA